ncbi:YtzI protein [Bacillus sp. T33-2]|uniref:YtzI protein n=1 Tax=Bacillus sp. T33-2 TaxID=2054168 RepID=UPI000C761183|nr:YtzI protein [Bacillus sp. T33-2]PLR98246.1 YtzI protein [Bacillus sp. T33-2]
MYTVLIISIIIIFVVLILAVVTTSKAYSYKHTVDPIENNPYLREAAGENQPASKENKK